MKLVAFLTFAVAGAVAAFKDCDPASDAAPGDFGPATFHNETVNGTIFFSLAPSAGPGPFPLVVFMHGSTGQWDMYADNLRHVVSHGFTLVFPFIKSPEGDKNPLTTNTNGKYLLKAITYAAEANAVAGSPLSGKVDSSNLVVAGHSMGGTCSLEASLKLVREKHLGLKLNVAMHPGICGPIGPPPWPSTWMKGDLRELTAALPVLFTTATNDAAFWPAPHTAEHEYGCFEGGVADAAPAAVFAQFSETACAEDGTRKPFPDGGHNCPLKIGSPEFAWALTAMKLYAQQGGSAKSSCHDLLLGSSTSSLQNATAIAKADVRQAA